MLREWPSVSFVCATYGRCPHKQHLLEEMLEGFVRNREDYPGHCELILLNDCPSQKLVCDVPGVWAVNREMRFNTLGEKLNSAILLAKGEIILPQDDDDISLPWRARLSVEKLGDADVYNPRAYWFASGDKVQHEQMTGYAHNCSTFRKSAWVKAGGYPHLSGPQDAAIDGKLRERCRYIEGPPLSPEETFFVYRWGVSDLHLSAFHPNEQAVYNAHGTKPVLPGTFTLVPRWSRDWCALTSS